MAGHPPGFLALVNEAKSRIREVAAAELPALLKQNPAIRLIDTREESEYAAGHVRGAEWIGKGVIERDIESKHPDHDTPLYLYCGGGFRSALAADALQRMGYTQVVSVDGGWRELKSLLPTE
ncbi:rhodanese-like domain-containing protein [Phenylobacterium sp.]|uniref:rhodanese-like domain-containing protein n=1 Tax=Phenylobacterium sp. TaxID=1871053 RepID=UPI00273781DE|nr:rhodanese-like domain-containing protein [Phenylobacterium sp.]MDP3870846.1 rhodanese-like domain-containing protein [Phenylobacterium sp.]